MKTQTLHAYAKVNLALDITGKRQDGYHTLDMLNVRVSLHDTISFTPAADCAVTYEGIKTPGNDIVRRAIEGYAVQAGNKAMLAHAHVTKRIPCEAGLGGGSADAAAVLLAMQAHYGALESTAQKALALSLGADVPYCMQRGPCRVRGIGEIVEPLHENTPLHLVLLKPKDGISTANLFHALDLPALPQRPDIGAACRALEAGDTYALARSLGNAMQHAAAIMLPEITALCTRLRVLGALGACMSGSGSAVFGLFPNEASAHRAQNACTDVCFHHACQVLSFPV